MVKVEISSKSIEAGKMHPRSTLKICFIRSFDNDCIKTPGGACQVPDNKQYPVYFHPESIE